MRWPSWVFDRSTRYRTLVAAGVAAPSGRNVAGASASAGASLTAVTDTGRARLGTKRALSGSGSNAGSPIAAHTRRPPAPVKPATGFHAPSIAHTRSMTATLSQPFHGKSLSLTVR